MSLKRMLFAGAAISLIAPVTDVSAQYRYYDRPAFDRQHPAQPPKPNASALKKPVTSAKKPAEVIAKPMPASMAPLTEAQIAAKAVVDELLARDPALVAAKEIPDSALARAAAAKHNAEQARLAALRVQQEAEAAKRKELNEKNKAREQAKAASMKPKQDLQANGKPKLELGKSHSAAVKASAPEATGAPVQPLLRMPAPEGPPAPRNL